MPNPNRGSCGFQSNEFEQEYDRPSKSQLKREMTALQKLGEELIALSKDRVRKVPMPEDVREAILACQTIRDHEGRRRQLQYVGKKMRSLTEEEVAQIQRMLESFKGGSRAETALLHATERKRERLLADDNALTELLARHPELDAQHLRTLIRNARREQEQNKPPKAYREIFQILKDLGTASATRIAGAAAAQEADEASGDEDDES
ncbi:ribosome biogenesis factor YjgA [Massilia sp. W12]|uniref:ribosome biogenesis factor YjgA n=1 Tax=Massilia sp. W12 TaxID=3126507 RepID=UPI0030CF829C